MNERHIAMRLAQGAQDIQECLQQMQSEGEIEDDGQDNNRTRRTLTVRPFTIEHHRQPARLEFRLEEDRGHSG